MSCLLFFSFINLTLVLKFAQIAEANKILFPAMAAVKFPDLEVNYSAGKLLMLPFRSNGNGNGNVADANMSALPKASLLCLSFRASSQVRNLVVLYYELANWAICLGSIFIFDKFLKKTLYPLSVNW
jgi:hypothetical protein